MLLRSLFVHYVFISHVPAARLPGPQRISQGNLRPEHQSYFYLCTGQGDAAAAGRGAAPPDTQDWVSRQNRSDALRMAPRLPELGLQTAARVDEGAILGGQPPSPEVALMFVCE